MSNKDYNKLNPIDRMLREALPPTMTNGKEVQVIIRKICGFELFNTRPYHNYETWSDGYEINGHGISVTSEDLDDAVKLFCSKLKEKTPD